MLYFDSDKIEITKAEYNIRVSAGKKFGTWKFEKQPAMKQYSTARQVARELEEANAPVPDSKATFIWKKAMMRSDKNMPRHAEDILDGMADKSGVAKITLDRLQAKKDKRGERP
jgi:DNA primase large subunit